MAPPTAPPLALAPPRCQTRGMSTPRPRLSLSETPELARALDDAAQIWPELRDNRAALLCKLVEAGWQTVTRLTDERVAAQRRAVHRAAGALTGVYPPHAARQARGQRPS